MGVRVGSKRGKYKRRSPGNKRLYEQALETPWDKKGIATQLNMVRARIRMFQASMHGVKYRLKKLKGELDIKLIEEYQDLNKQLFKFKKVENYLTYQNNML